MLKNIKTSWFHLYGNEIENDIVFQMSSCRIQLRVRSHLTTTMCFCPVFSLCVCVPLIATDPILENANAAVKACPRVTFVLASNVKNGVYSN